MTHVAADRMRRTLLSGVMVGIGVVGTLDEVVLHQLLDWHHFVDLTVYAGAPLDERTRSVGLVADGLFHIVSTLLLGWGVLRLRSDFRTPWEGWQRRFWAGFCLGFGGFNLYDAVIQHKVLRLHEVRRGVDNLLPYDLVFGGIAAIVLVLGVLLLRTVRPSPQRAP